MQYPKISERFAAAFIDWLLYTTFCLGFYLVWVQFFSFGSTPMLRIVGFLAIILNVGVMVGYKVLFEGGKLQATPGKLVMGLKVVDATGARAPWIRVLLRTWPWWIFFIVAITEMLLVGGWVNGIIWLILLGLFFTVVLPPGGRCLHDIVSGLYVIKAGPGMVGGGRMDISRPTGAPPPRPPSDDEATAVRR